MLKTLVRSLKYTPLLRQSSLGAYSFSQQPKTPFNNTGIEELEKLTTNQYISKNVGLQRFLQKVYNTTGLSILAALGTSYAVLSLPISAAGMSTLAFGGMFATLVGLIGSAYMKPTVSILSEQLNNREKVQILVSTNSFMRKALYGMGIIGLGLSAPLIGFANMMNPTILPTALGLTAALFGGASMAAYRMPKDSLLSYGRILGGSLLGLIGLQLVGLGSLYFVGMNPFATMLLNTSTYVSVGLFTAFIAYDTHVAVRMYEQQMPDHLSIAANFVLDFWNILVSLIRIFTSND